MEKENKTIKPEIPGGFMDLLPEAAIAQEALFAKIKKIYKSFGYAPLDTPCMERTEVLTGGDKNFNKSIFIARVVKGEEDKKASGAEWEDSLGLRFDLTVPLSRVVSANPELVKPFKRYQIGKVWRGENSQAGRYREFYQCDFDIIGSNSILSDIEVVLVMNETLLALGVNNFTIRFNTRKILNGLAELAGCAERAKDFFRVVDKFDKIGTDGVLAELKRQPENAEDTGALGLSDEQAIKVRDFLQLVTLSKDKVLDGLKEFFAGSSGLGEEGVKELTEISEALTKLEIPSERWRIDLSVARGLDYYTGPVFETTLNEMPELGSIFSGGRYDGLTNRFMENSNVPGIGASIGLSRLTVALKKLGLLPKKDSVTEALVTVSAGLEMEALKISQQLRTAGINTEIYFGQDYTFRAQLSYAAKKNILFVVIAGEDEIKSGIVQLKNMSTREQKPLIVEEAIREMLNAKSAML
jgi:histidyl-tRNA synthetase